MRVETIETKTITYYISFKEHTDLVRMGFWGYIKERLKDNERIVIEQG